MIFRCNLSVFALILFFTANASALVIRGYTPTKHDLYTNFPSSPSSNPTFYHSNYDFSGVGWSVQDSRKHFAMISSRHFVTATHFRPAPGSQVAFLNQRGQVKTFVVERVDSINNAEGKPTDLSVGTLEYAIPADDGIAAYDIARGSEALLNGQRILVVGQTSSVGEGTISGFINFGGDPLTGGSGVNDTRAYQFTYAGFAGSQNDSHGERGDSGSPSFIVSGGQLSVVGIHLAILTTLGSTATIDTFVPAYAEEVAAIMDRSQQEEEEEEEEDQSAEDPVVDSGGDPVQNPSENGNNPGQGEETPDPVVNHDPGTTNTDPPEESDPAPQSGYEVWAEDLADTTYEGDSDGDGIVNLLEYAHGGDPRHRSQITPGGQPILPQWDGPSTFSYLRLRQTVSSRVDYTLEVSATLATWEAETNAHGYFATDTHVQPLAPPMQDYERVTKRVIVSAERPQFSRLQVTYKE